VTQGNSSAAVRSAMQGLAMRMSMLDFAFCTAAALLVTLAACGSVAVFCTVEPAPEQKLPELPDSPLSISVEALRQEGSSFASEQPYVDVERPSAAGSVCAGGVPSGFRVTLSNLHFAGLTSLARFVRDHRAGLNLGQFEVLAQVQWQAMDSELKKRIQFGTEDWALDPASYKVLMAIRANNIEELEAHLNGGSSNQVSVTLARQIATQAVGGELNWASLDQSFIDQLLQTADAWFLAQWAFAIECQRERGLDLVVQLAHGERRWRLRVPLKMSVAATQCSFVVSLPGDAGEPSVSRLVGCALNNR
jgi:hypothetical protein